MLRNIFLCVIWINHLSPAHSQIMKISNLANGKLITIDSFNSDYVDDHTIVVWLPGDYTPAKKYGVVYMHDGQMLFDSTKSWNGQEWQVDENVSKLLREKSIMDVIVVGIYNNGLHRNAEYFPEAILELMPNDLRNRVIHEWLTDKPQGDHYLLFITSELKAFIDANYSTYPDQQHTFIMGASMGGLISLYALIKYPGIFRGAGCLSTHWPLLNPVPEEAELLSTVPPYFIDYLKQHLPDPGSHLIYFDHGTETLDALYGPFQVKVDAVMKARGYTQADWMSRVFEGEDHSEKAWAKRLEIPLRFLVAPTE